MTATRWEDYPLYLDLQHVQALLGWSRDAVYRAVRSGRLPAPQYTRPMRWSRKDLERSWAGEATSRPSSRGARGAGKSQRVTAFREVS